MKKTKICLCENKDADQLRGNREADQPLCFRYSDSTIPLLLKSEFSSFWLFSVLVQADLCRTCSETTSLVFPRGGSYKITPDDPNDRYCKFEHCHEKPRPKFLLMFVNLIQELAKN